MGKLVRYGNAMVELPGYTIDEELGRGGMGVVYSARHDATGRAVAIKILQPGTSDSARRRFLREADAARAAAHPGIVPVHESGAHGDLLYLVMERIDGENLQEKLDRDGPLPADAAVRVVGQVAQAVQALHDAGVVHRDIKPANVLLTADGRAMLTDFGIAEPPLDSATVHGLTQDSQWLQSADASAETVRPTGTFAYMAPEQWRGETVDARADVYGLGGLLFSALTGSPPFTGRTLPELVYAVIMAGPPKANVTRKLDTVIAEAMAGDPDDRFSSATEFHRAMLHGTAGKRGRSVRWLIAGALAVIALATTVVLISGGDDSRTLTVCAKNITLRPEPRSQTVVAEVVHGEKVHVIESGGTPNWIKVETTDGRRGWAVVNFLSTTCQ